MKKKLNYRALCCTLMFFTIFNASSQNSVAWNGSVNSSWSLAGNWTPPVIPDSTSDVTITTAANQPVISADGSANTITMDANTSLIVQSGSDLTITDVLTVNNTASLLIENGANLLQVNNVLNTGNIKVKRNSSAIKRQDYTLWSSPVANQNLLAFSPFTVVSPTSRFYQYNTSTNLYNSITSPSSTNFNDAQGYLIRVANNHPTYAATWNGQFTGVPHNGNYPYTMSNNGAGFRFNLVGNPYPSPISAMAFTAQNSASITQTLYFWRETNGNTTNNAYCTWSPAGGGNGTFVSNGEPQVVNPNGVIQTGQGFFVEAINAATQLDFNNSMRVANNANQFFRPSSASSPNEVESHRIWLNVTNDTGAFCQTAFGYMSNATQGLDVGIDGKYINDGDTELYTMIDTGNYVIQGRTLPFTASDIVPLGFKATAPGSYSIAIDHLDGLFAGSQNIYLKDNLTGGQHDLKSGPYGFTTDAGTFTSRFEVLYQPSLATSGPLDPTSNVAVYKQFNRIMIYTGIQPMADVQIFDISGRLLAEKDNIDAAQTYLNADFSNGVVVVRITLKNGATVSKKIII
jgi:hypothetical protein